MNVEAATTDVPAALSWQSILRLVTVGRQSLPNGKNLRPGAFRARHNVGLSVAVVLWLFIAAFGILAGDDLTHHLAELVPMTLALLLAFKVQNRRLAALSVVFVFMSACSLLIHLTDGLIESHFLFFVLLPVISLYQDWRAFLASIAFVVFHHFVVGIIDPTSVYNHEDAILHPFKWGTIHAAYFIGLVVALVIEWNFSETAQRLATNRLKALQTAQADLAQAQKLESVGQLAAGIAHEINTPMQYIGDNTHFLKATVTRLLSVAAAAEAATAAGATEVELNALATVLQSSKVGLLADKAPRAADDALAGVESVSSIVAAMKRFSHPASDEMEKINLNDALATTLTVSRNEWKYFAEVETDFDDDLPTVEGRHGRLNQVWLNMIVNATHAIQERHGNAKGLLTLTTAASVDGKSVEVRINDNGAGIDEENLPRVFDHFFTTKQVGKGTGQGLSLAYSIIVEGHHGQIDIESVVGAGTTFIVTLPITQTTPAMPTDDLERVL